MDKTDKKDVKDKVTKTHYVRGGERYDRITHVLGYFPSPTLLAWRERIGKKEAKKVQKTAKQIGTRVHNLVYQHWQTRTMKLTANDSVSVLNCIKAYSDWEKAEHPTIVSMEDSLFSDELGVAGTYDIVMEKGTRTLVDIKTSTRIQPNYWIQLAVYAHMYGDVDRIAILRLDKFTGDYEYKVRDNEPRYFEVFLGLLGYYRFITGGDI